MKTYFEIDNVPEELISNQDYSNFAVAEAIVKTVGQGLEMGGKIADASARKKEAEAKITEISGQRQAQLDKCETAKELKGRKRKEKITQCKNEVRQRFDADEKEQKEIVRKMTAIEEQKIVESTGEKKFSKQYTVIGWLVALGMILGTIVYLKKKG